MTDFNEIYCVNAFFINRRKDVEIKTKHSLTSKLKYSIVRLACPFYSLITK